VSRPAVRRAIPDHAHPHARLSPWQTQRRARWPRRLPPVQPTLGGRRNVCLWREAARFEETALMLEPSRVLGPTESR
jgi:hypothetical protein